MQYVVVAMVVITIIAVVIVIARLILVWEDERIVGKRTQLNGQLFIQVKRIYIYAAESVRAIIVCIIMGGIHIPIHIRELVIQRWYEVIHVGQLF